MLSWINDSNKYEEIQKSYFGNYEITILKFSAGGGWAWIKQPNTAFTILKKNYPEASDIEEIKDNFIKSLHEYLDERVNYWKTVQYSLMEAELEDN